MTVGEVQLLWLFLTIALALFIMSASLLMVTQQQNTKLTEQNQRLTESASEGEEGLGYYKAQAEFLQDQNARYDEAYGVLNNKIEELRDEVDDHKRAAEQWKAEAQRLSKEMFGSPPPRPQEEETRAEVDGQETPA